MCGVLLAGERSWRVYLAMMVDEFGNKNRYRMWTVYARTVPFIVSCLLFLLGFRGVYGKLEASS